jgi:hypothetical protein
MRPGLLPVAMCECGPEPVCIYFIYILLRFYAVIFYLFIFIFLAIEACEPDSIENKTCSKLDTCSKIVHVV